MIVSILLVLMLALGVYVASHRLSGLQTIVVAAIFIVGLTLVVLPQAATYVAIRLGVGRGTDLLLYGAIVGGLFVAANLYFRVKTQEMRIAELARAQAVGNALTRYAEQRKDVS